MTMIKNKKNGLIIKNPKNQNKLKEDICEDN